MRCISKKYSKGWQVACWLLVTLPFLSSGCQDPNWKKAWGIHTSNEDSNDRISAPLGSISIYQLAGRLNMTVEQQSEVAATLRDGRNVVMVYPNPGGQVYVNGRSLESPGLIEVAGEMIFVSETLTDRIARLRLEQKMAPAPVPVPERINFPTGPPQSSQRALVVIDPGHGGKDPGAISPIGVREKVVVLETAQTLSQYLQRQGITPHLTRDSDTFIELDDRAPIANRLKADLFVSVHADSCGNPSVQGFTVYIAKNSSNRSKVLANAIERRMSALGVPSRGVREANYRVLVQTQCPAVLIELGYLSSPEEARKLNRQEYRSRLAEAIADGVSDYLNQTR